MPIHNMNYDSGIFFAKQVGYVDHVDIRMWHNALNKYASASDTSTVAVIDMRQIDRLCPTVTKIFTTALAIPNVVGIALIVSDAMYSRNDRVFKSLSELSGIRIFSNLDEGQTFAHTILKPSIGYVGAYFQAHYL